MTAGHPISKKDPVLRGLVREAMDGSVREGTLSGYKTGAGKYMDFCDLYGINKCTGLCRSYGSSHG